MIEGDDGRRAGKNECGGGRDVINVCEDRKSWVDLIVVDKSNSRANGDVHDGVAALRASRIGEAKGAEGGRPRAGRT